ncbi:hypothetical protein O181_127993 [Austropuccinia psidii MF-1]|uniref:Uncharacterized protein n=1 Tax=Austropuccinia psidii MF-1 TaxID=1389203 RepID=A0A9Q3KVE9_9BASI|nr:hypothetical protein [Austropuccinia psidii MF-1]
MKGGGPKPKVMAGGLEAPRIQKDPPGPESKIKAWGLVRWKLAKEANDGRIWPEARNGQMAIEHQRGPIGHKRCGVANLPQLGSRLESPQHPWMRANLHGCDSTPYLEW